MHAPESNESGYYDAKNFLIDLIRNKSVYLDIDDIYEKDQYGRLVCVAYIRYNSTHFENVNKALSVGGYAVIDNYYNEFNPYIWTLYVNEDEIPEFSSFLLPLVFIVATLPAVIVYRRRNHCK